MENPVALARRLIGLAVLALVVAAALLGIGVLAGPVLTAGQDNPGFGLLALLVLISLLGTAIFLAGAGSWLGIQALVREPGPRRWYDTLLVALGGLGAILLAALVWRLWHG